MIETLNSSTIRNELNAMSQHHLFVGKTIKSISDLNAFCKSFSYKALRKNQLSGTEIAIFFEYTYSNEEISFLLINKIKNLNIAKAIEYGIINYICEDSNRWLPGTIRKFFLSHVKIENSEKDLDKLIQFFNYRRTYNKSNPNDVDVFINLIQELWFGRQSDFAEKERVQNLLIVKKYYKEIFDFVKVEKQIQSVFTATPRRGGNNTLFFDSGTIEIVEQKKRNEPKGFEHQKEIDKLLITFMKCPYLDVDFANSLLDEFSLFTPLEKIYLRLAFLMHQLTDPFIDLSKEFKKISYLHSIWGVEKSLQDLTKTMFSKSEIFIRNFNLNLERSPTLSKKEKKNLYEEFFLLTDMGSIEANDNEQRLKLMILLGVEDTEIATFLELLFNRYGVRTYYLNDIYSCTVSKRETYPGPKTLEVIVKQELLQTFYTKEFAGMGDIWDLYYNMSHPGSNNHLFLTWKMANSPDFLKRVIFSRMGESRKRQLMSSINLNNIGFKRYLILLEDYSRSRKEKVFTTVSRNALRFATKTELYMYKSKIPSLTLLGSKSIDYKIINYFLTLKDKQESRNPNIYIDVNSLVTNGLIKNKNISKIELIDILERLHNAHRSYRLYQVRKNLEKPRTVCINILGEETNLLSVKDFCDYRDNKKGGY